MPLFSLLWGSPLLEGFNIRSFNKGFAEVTGGKIKRRWIWFGVDTFLWTQALHCQSERMLE